MSINQQHLLSFIIGACFAALITTLLLTDDGNQYQDDVFINSIDSLKDAEIKNIKNIKDPVAQKQATIDLQQKIHALVMRHLDVNPQDIPGPKQMIEEINVEAEAELEAALQEEEMLVDLTKPQASLLPPPPEVPVKTNQKLYHSNSLTLKRPKSYLKAALPIVGKSDMLNFMQGKWQGDIEVNNGGEWIIKLDVNLSFSNKLYSGKVTLNIKDPSRGTSMAKATHEGVNKLLQKHPKDANTIIIQASNDYFVHIRKITGPVNYLAGILYKYKKNKSDFGPHGDFKLYPSPSAR